MWARILKGFGHDPSAGYNAAPLLAGDLQAEAHELDRLTDGLGGRESGREALIMSQEAPALGWIIFLKNFE
jgi:hypothetical protein